MAACPAALFWRDAEVEVRYLFHLLRSVFESPLTGEETEVHAPVPSPASRRGLNQSLCPAFLFPPPSGVTGPCMVGSPREGAVERLTCKISGDLSVCGGAGCCWSGWKVGLGVVTACGPTPQLQSGVPLGILWLDFHGSQSQNGEQRRGHGSSCPRVTQRVCGRAACGGRASRFPAVAVRCIVPTVQGDPGLGEEEPASQTTRLVRISSHNPHSGC